MIWKVQGIQINPPAVHLEKPYVSKHLKCLTFNRHVTIMYMGITVQRPITHYHTLYLFFDVEILGLDYRRSTYEPVVIPFKFLFYFLFWSYFIKIKISI